MKFDKVLEIIKDFKRDEQRDILAILEEYSLISKKIYFFTKVKQEQTQFLKKIENKRIKSYYEMIILEELSASAQKFLYFMFRRSKNIISNKLLISECAKEEIDKYISKKDEEKLIGVIKAKTFKSLYREKSILSKGTELFYQFKAISKADGEYGIKKLSTTKDNKSIHIFVNGFTNDKEGNNFKEWIKSSSELFGNNVDLYGFDWPSGKMSSLAKILIKSAAKSRLVPSKFLLDLILSVIPEWKQARDNAEKYSEELAKFIKEEYKKNPNIKINLYGHSLGARLIYFALDNLTNSDIKVEEVFFFGGAVHIDEVSATDILRFTKNIYNFYSYNDYILWYMYRIAEIGDEPIGLNKIRYKNTKEKIGNLYNFDVNEFISGHTVYIENFDILYRRKYRCTEYS